MSSTTRRRSGLYVPRAGGTTPTFVSSSSGGVTSTITKPSGLSVGDHLLIVTFENVFSALTATGFISLGDYLDEYPGGNYGHVLYRQIDGTESSTFTTSAAVNYAAVAYRGGYGPPALLNGTASTSASTSIPGRFIAPADGLVIHAFMAAGDPGVGGQEVATAPASGVTSRATSSTGKYWSVNVSDEAATAGSDVSRTGTASTSNNVGLHLAFMLPTSATLPAAIGEGYLGNSGNSANASITIPSYAQAGDLFIAAFEVTANTITAGLSGFTAFDTGSHSGGTFSSGYWWGYKVLVSGDVGATQSITSGSQVWGSAGLLIRNPGATPVSTTGTMTSGTTSTATLVGVTSSGAARMAVSMWSASQSPAPNPSIDPSSINGVVWREKVQVNLGYGGLCLAIQAVASGATSLAPATGTIAGSPTWQTNTALIGI